MAVQTKMTTAEFLELPETNERIELIDGAVVVTAPELDHQDYLLNTAVVLRNLAPHGKVRVAPVDVHLDDADIVQPDVLWTSPESACIPVGKKYLRGAPELVIEVLSPSTALRDKQTKFHLYEKHGVRECWIIDPLNQYLEVWQSIEGRFVLLGVYGAGDTFASAVLGQKTVDVGALFGG
jgi:Uma2 family endonuclease